MKHVKEYVLSVLSRDTGYVSGEALGEAIGASRAAVWRAVRELRAGGEEILSDPKRGYRLIAKSGEIRPSTLWRKLPALGRVECYQTLPSTNDRAREMALSGAPAWSVAVADGQTAGRGRFSRSFVSEAGRGLYFSVVLRPACSAEKTSMLTTCAAVAVAEAIERVCHVRVGIKWVNDLWVGDKKICGILTEGALDAESGRLSYAVLGIGINVLHTDFPAPLAEIAASLEDVCGKAPDRAALLTEVLSSLYAHFLTFESGDYLAAYRARSVLDGKRVTVSRGGETYEALVRGIGEQGELLITRGQEELALTSGEVASVHPAGTQTACRQENKETR